MAKRPNATERLWASYHQAVGEAFTEWAEIEQTLAYYFRAATGGSHSTTFAVFFSGRNFNTRCDMLKAATKAGPMKHESKKLILAALAVAGRYSSFRNCLAHDRHIHVHNDQIYCVTGENEFAAINSGKAFTVRDIRQAVENFRKLRRLLDGPETDEPESQWMPRHTLELQLLPTDAHSNEPRPIPQSRQAKSQNHRPKGDRA